MAGIENVICEMDKINASSLGEVIMLVGPHLVNTKILPGDEAVFKAVIGIYNGIYNEYYEKDNQRIYNVVSPKHPVELGVLKVHGVPGPVCAESFVLNVMNVEPETKAYIGAEEIRSVLEKQGMGFFNKFFEEYVQKYRKIG